MNRRVQDNTSGATKTYHHQNNNNDSAAAAAAAAAQAQENDAILKALMSDLQSMRATNTAIGGEIRHHNAILDAMDQAFTRARGALSRTSHRLEDITGVSSVFHMWFMVLFAFGVLMYIYFYLKFS